MEVFDVKFLSERLTRSLSQLLNLQLPDLGIIFNVSLIFGALHATMRQCNGDIWQRPLFAFFTQPNSAVPLWIVTIASTQLNATHHHPSQMQLSKRWHISCLSVFSHACPCLPTCLDLIVPWDEANHTHCIFNLLLGKVSKKITVFF